jgi:hypothetical protein
MLVFIKTKTDAHMETCAVYFTPLGSKWKNYCLNVKDEINFLIDSFYCCHLYIIRSILFIIFMFQIFHLISNYRMVTIEIDSNKTVSKWKRLLHWFFDVCHQLKHIDRSINDCYISGAHISLYDLLRMEVKIFGKMRKNYQHTLLFNLILLIRSRIWIQSDFYFLFQEKWNQ